MSFGILLILCVALFVWGGQNYTNIDLLQNCGKTFILNGSGSYRLYFVGDKMVHYIQLKNCSVVFRSTRNSWLTYSTNGGSGNHHEQSVQSHFPPSTYKRTFEIFKLSPKFKYHIIRTYFTKNFSHLQDIITQEQTNFTAIGYKFSLVGVEYDTNITIGGNLYFVITGHKNKEKDKEKNKLNGTSDSSADDNISSIANSNSENANKTTEEKHRERNSHLKSMRPFDLGNIGKTTNIIFENILESSKDYHFPQTSKTNGSIFNSSMINPVTNRVTISHTNKKNTTQNGSAKKSEESGVGAPMNVLSDHDSENTPDDPFGYLYPIGNETLYPPAQAAIPDQLLNSKKMAVGNKLSPAMIVAVAIGAYYIIGVMVVAGLLACKRIGDDNKNSGENSVKSTRESSKTDCEASVESGPSENVV